MVWIFAAIVLCLAVFVPAFRKVMLIGAGLLALVVVVMVNNDRRPTPPPAASNAAPLPPPPPPREIPVKQIEVGNMRSNFGNAGNRVSSITVRVYNNSAQDTLDQAEYQLLIEDCDKKRASCATVDDEKGSFYLEVPPHQARDATISTKAAPWNEVTILGSPHIKVLITKAIAAK